MNQKEMFFCTIKSDGYRERAKSYLVFVEGEGDLRTKIKKPRKNVPISTRK